MCVDFFTISIFIMRLHLNLNSDTDRRIHIHGGIVDTNGCSLLLFHFLDHDWVRKCILEIYAMCAKEFNCLFVYSYCISLGDYIPGDDPDIDYRSIYKIGTTFYLIMGK